jgi:hypothetical protein
VLALTTIVEAVYLICHSKSAIELVPQDVITSTRWNNIWDIIECREHSHQMPAEHTIGL